jgi:hypothetical protein
VKLDVSSPRATAKRLNVGERPATAVTSALLL